MKPLILKAVLLASAVSTLAAAAVPATAAERNRTRSHSGTYQGTRGDHSFGGNYDSTTTRDRGNVDRSTTWTGNNGKTGTSTYNRTVDPSTKSWNSSNSTTYGNGKTTSTSTTGVKTDTGATINRTYTGVNGNTVTSTKDVSKGADGGLTSTGSYTTSGGKTGTFTQTGVKTENGRQVETVTTLENGKTVTKTVDTSHQDGTASKTITYTGPNGNTRTVTGSGTYSKNP